MSSGISPKPGGLVDRMLEQETAKWQSAAVALSEPPEVIDVSAWYEQHVALLHQFLHRALKVVANTPSRRNTQLIQRFGETHAELMQHTRKIAGDAIPAVLSRDGQYLIQFDRLAEARAKVKALTAELTLAREEMDTLKVEGWQPAFDVMSPRQEELVIQFCQEIAGRKGEPGSPPDPVCAYWKWHRPSTRPSVTPGGNFPSHLVNPAKNSLCPSMPSIGSRQTIPRVAHHEAALLNQIDAA